MSYKRPESVLVVIYDLRARVLVLQRKDDPEFWQSVTGAVEGDESPVQTAYREVLEETGIDLSLPAYKLLDCRQTNQYLIRKQWRHRYPPDTPCNTEYVFAVQVVGDELISLTEHLCYFWLDKPEAAAKVWSDTNRQAIRAFVPEYM